MNDLLEITPSVQDRARISTQVCDSTASLLHALESGVGGEPYGSASVQIFGDLHRDQD